MNCDYHVVAARTPIAAFPAFSEAARQGQGFALHTFLPLFDKLAYEMMV